PRDSPGQEPAVVLLHGFPDDLHLYDRLVPELAGRRVVGFDFLGWGASDKPTGYPYTVANQSGDLDPVIQQLGPGSGFRVSPPAPSSPGPPAISGGRDPPGAGRRAGAAQHLLRRHARAAGPPGDLAVLHPAGPVGRPPGVAAVRGHGVP